MSTCLQCKVSINSYTRRHQFCSPRCYKAWHRERLVEARAQHDEAVGRSCAHPECSTSLAGRRSNVVYCTIQCRERAKRLPERKDREPKPKGQSGPRPGRRKWETGQRFGELTLVAYTDPSPSGDSRAAFDCDCGTRGKVLRLNNVVRGATTTCADRSRHGDYRSRGESVTAGTRHKQLTARHGSPSTRPCVMCGSIGRGNDWAYRHSSFEERCQLTGKDRGQVYSLDDADYWVMCRRHHMRWDDTHRRTVPKGLVSGPHVALALAFSPTA